MTTLPPPSVALLTFASGDTVSCSSVVGAKPCEGVEPGELGIYRGLLLSGLTAEGTARIRIAVGKAQPFTMTCNGHRIEWRIEPMRGDPVHAMGEIVTLPETFAKLVIR